MVMNVKTFFSTENPVNQALHELRACLSPIMKEYDKGEIIAPIGSNDESLVGIVESGTAFLLTINSSGQRRIVDYYERGGFFWSGLFPKTDEGLYYLTAKTKCRINYISYEKLTGRCQNNCQKHTALLNSFIKSASKKLCVHIDILSHQTLRGRLMAYFEYLEFVRGTSSFTLPLSFTDLADYIAADRSAMMRELKRLSDEEIISAEKHRITLRK